MNDMCDCVSSVMSVSGFMTLFVIEYALLYQTSCASGSYLPGSQLFSSSPESVA